MHQHVITTVPEYKTHLKNGLQEDHQRDDRPVSLISIPGKITGSIIKNKATEHMHKLFGGKESAWPL